MLYYFIMKNSIIFFINKHFYFVDYQQLVEDLFLNLIKFLYALVHISEDKDSVKNFISSGCKKGRGANQYFKL